jgi:excisionase family DNA binding protein
MIPAVLALAEGERRTLARLCALAERLDAGDENAWPDYLATVTTLRALIPEERQPLMTTQQMASRLQVSPKTVRKLGKAKKLDSIRLGQRGTGAIRWRA